MDTTDMKMFCAQCQETSHNTGCTHYGCCGKNPHLSNLMDYLINILKGISYYSEFSDKFTLNRTVGLGQAAEFIMRSLFMTITNANFDDDAVVEQIRAALRIRNELGKDVLEYSNRTNTPIVGNFANDSLILTTHLKDILCDDAIARFTQMMNKDSDVAVSEKKDENFDVFVVYSPSEKLGLTMKDIDKDKLHTIAFRCNPICSIKDADKRGLCELILFGLKGMAAYLVHALNLGYRSSETEKFIIRCLVKLEESSSLSYEDLIEIVLETGRHGKSAMLILDKANTTVFGNPVATEINEYCVCPPNNASVDDSVEGMIPLSEEQTSLFVDHPTILVSGHDLNDLNILLTAIEEEHARSGVEIKVFTHSEMLPTNAYPSFKGRFKQYLVGNFGLSWWRQITEFNSFPGCFLFTTNCIIPYKESCSYAHKVYTTGEVGCPIARYLDKKNNFIEIIEQAKSVFNRTTREERLKTIEDVKTKKIIIGFGHTQVAILKDEVLDAIRNKQIKEFVVMSGCDGRHKTRNYYSKFANALPKSSVILTSGCAKYRYNMLDLGTIDDTPIPRLLDAGQCNDSISLVLIADFLAEQLKTDLEKLPLRFNIAWYEQKAIIVFLALLACGIKNIRLGPTLPGFATPEIVNTLVKNFGIKVISENAIQGDVEDIL